MTSMLVFFKLLSFHHVWHDMRYHFRKMLAIEKRSEASSRRLKREEIVNLEEFRLPREVIQLKSSV